MLPYLWIAAAVVVLDQLSKFAAVHWLVRHEEVALLPFLNLTLVYNAGAAFGFLNSASGWQNFFFITIALIATAVIVLWLLRLGRGDLLVAVALTLVLGGAVGNVIDRLIYGHVVDFIDVVFGTWHFWTFNIADSAISIGAVLLVLDAFGIGKSRSA
jgi:signal peptidase II